jgi:FO synthase
VAPLSAAATSALRRALHRASDGASLNLSEAAVLLEARGEALAELMECGARVRDAGLSSAGRARVITYSPKVFMPLTRLCRDRCHYCTFAAAPNRVPSAYLEIDEVIELARDGAEHGCKEVLFTLGDRPEERWPQARQWLEERGYDSTVSYLRAVCVRVLEETGLLPHVNAGVLTWHEMQRLKPVAPSMGLMLETSSRRLFEVPGAPHYGSPDKDPAVRLRMLEDAGRLSIPFTTGLLVGIGETPRERAETLFALRSVARQYGGVQEVIIQNFVSKADTVMRDAPSAEVDELVAAVAVSRLVLGARIRIQAPPNLVDLEVCARLIRAGIDDWGGISPLTPDHVNPEKPWPAVDALAEVTSAAGFLLRERLTVYPEYLREPWLEPRLQGHVAALAGVDGLAVPGARPTGRAWQEPNGGWVESGRVDLHVRVDAEGRTQRVRQDVDEVYGDWRELAENHSVPDAANSSRVPRGGRARPAYLAALRRAQDDPPSMSDDDALQLMQPECDSEMDALAALADAVRRDAAGEDVTYVVNRNVNFTNVCYTGCRFCAFAQRRADADAYTLSLEQVEQRAAEAWAAGATEVCMQGGIDPALPADSYFRLAEAIKRGAPGIHLHAFSPMEVVNGAARTGLSVRDWLVRARDSGMDSIPGTAAEILDDDVRWILTRGKLPASAWIEVITAAHALGIRSTSTMMFGHVDKPAHWVAHLRLLARLQDETGGFTEFVPLPFVHENAPLYLAGLARPGPTRLESRAVHAMARLLLHGRIANIQCSWVKLGDDGCEQVLRGGVNDLGGTLMEETISRMAGSQHGSRRSVEQLERLAAAAGRSTRQRTTTYEQVSAERRSAALRGTVDLPLLVR